MTMIYLSVRQSALQVHTSRMFFRNGISLIEMLEILQQWLSTGKLLIWLLKKSLFGVFNIEGVKQLTMLRVEFSMLNGHKCRDNFQCSCPMCACSTAVEDNVHFFLHYSLFVPMLNDLLGQPSPFPGLDLN